MKKHTKKQKKIIDPQAKREASNYDRPIASRELLLDLLKDQGPLARGGIAEILGLVDDEEQLEGLRRRLNAMERDGQVVRNRKDGYLPLDESDLIRGRIMAHRDGFGFLIPDDGGDDLFITPRQMRQVLHGDRAVVRVLGIDRKGRREGGIIEVLERAHEQVVGRFSRGRGVGFVIPDNKRITQDVLIPQQHIPEDIVEGQIVIAAITAQPSRHSQPVGKIIEVLGDHMAPGMEIDIALRSHDLPHTWSEEVLKEISGFTEEVPEEAKKGKKDYRNTPLVTIDGEDARDFDDAVYCEREKNGWKLIVAIADVSSYVLPGTALDNSALERATSVYFPNQVIPMLPEVLSNGLCSIKPDVDRLCMVCEMHISVDGKLHNQTFYEGVMRSHARLTYNKVAAIISDGDKALRKEYKSVVPHLEDLFALYQVMRGARESRGSIDFETTETYIEFDDNRKISRISPRERNDAHKMIEECMIAANRSAAIFLKKHQLPSLYRAHDGPKTEKVEDLREFLVEFGLRLDGGDDPDPIDYARLMNQIQERPDKNLIQTVMLRSLSQAVYSPDGDTGHFGLSLEDYAHFTSPIRRYPDLLVHRGIRHVIRHGSAKGFEYNHTNMVSFGEHSSMCERRADDATRDVTDWLKCEYMQDKLGEVYHGTVSGVTSFGLFLELHEVFVEGLVHITSLPRDFYRFDAPAHRLVGKRSGKQYRLGDKLEVIVAAVNLDERKIDFELTENMRDGASRQKPYKKIKKKVVKKSKKKAESAKKKRKPRVKPKGKAKGAGKGKPKPGSKQKNK